MSQEKKNETVENFNHAVSVLFQATRVGIKAGIYEMEDLDLIIQASKFIGALKTQESETDEPVANEDTLTKED